MSDMKVLNAKETKVSLQKFKDFDPAAIEARVADFINHNIYSLKAGNKETFQYNPYLKSYLLILMYKKYILFGIEKSGFNTEASARKDALKTLKDIQKDKVPEYSVKRIILELDRLIAGMARSKSQIARRNALMSEKD